LDTFEVFEMALWLKRLSEKQKVELSWASVSFPSMTPRIAPVFCAISDDQAVLMGGMKVTPDY